MLAKPESRLIDKQLPSQCSFLYVLSLRCFLDFGQYGRGKWTTIFIKLALRGRFCGHIVPECCVTERTDGKVINRGTPPPEMLMYKDNRGAKCVLLVS